MSPTTQNGSVQPISIPPSKHTKLHGRAFYESIGSPKYVLAPMVEQSEFAWRMLSRSFFPPSESKQLLAYTPMFHSRMFWDTEKYRNAAFKPLKAPIPDQDGQSIPQYKEEELDRDGNPAIDRPLFVQYCSNKPEDFLNAAKYVYPFCDAVDLNLGCPQGIAKRGGYGAFLQEDWDTISSLISTLHRELPIPVTAKFRIQETAEKTLNYARMILSAGASIITVHGRRREQKGHNTGLADWNMIKYLRENLPVDTVIFANGNILRHDDIEECLRATGADGVMSAEGNLYDPSIFARPPAVGMEGREYWRGRNGKGGYRMDAIMRRYMDIIYKYCLKTDPPARKPLFLPSDPPADEPPNVVSMASEVVSSAAAALSSTFTNTGSAVTGKRKADDEQTQDQNQAKRQKPSKKKAEKITDPNLTAMQSHLFHLLRPLVAKHHSVRDALAKCRVGDIAAFENVLSMVESSTKDALIEYSQDPSSLAEYEDAEVEGEAMDGNGEVDGNGEETQNDPYESSVRTVARCKRPWFVCQPYVRPLPKEAIEKGALMLSKKELRKREIEAEEARKASAKEEKLTKEVGLEPGGRVEEQTDGEGEGVEVAREGLVCG